MNPVAAPVSTSSEKFADARASALRIELYNDFTVTIGGEPVPRQVWGRRQRARILLAMLIVARGRLSRTDVMANMWPYSPSYKTARNSLGVALCTIRQATQAAAKYGEDGSGRALILEPNSILWTPALRDSTDFDDVRNMIIQLASIPRMEYDDLVRNTATMLPMLQGNPLAWIAGSELAEDLEVQLASQLKLASKLLVEAWARNAQRFPSVPSIALEVARVACDLDPTDEPLAKRTMELHHSYRGAAAASQIYHSVASKLRGRHGLPPSLDLSRRHAEIIAGI